MKEVIKEIIKHEVVYVANDGTEFKDRKECNIYEESALGVIMQKLMPRLTKISEIEIIENDEHEYYFITPTSEDIDIINQLLIAVYPETKRLLVSDDIDSPILIGTYFYKNKIENAWFFRVSDLIAGMTNSEYNVTKAQA